MHVISIPGQQGEILLSCRGLTRAVDKHLLWSGLDFDVCRGDVLFVRGPSGVGKTLLLRTLACLDPVEVSGQMGLGRVANQGC
jgi:ABC-type transporter Mla maintaining outer membrane lipid asymmetry ATPase subunit MlaF